MHDLLRHVGRRIYGIPFVGIRFRRFLEEHRGQVFHHDATYWNVSLKGWASSYLGGTLQIDLRDSIAILLVRHLLPNATSVLDLGCGGATLALCLGPEFQVYWGVDISDVAICKAKENLATARRNAVTNFNLDVARVEDFHPPRRFDVIMFNEVLYYLSLKEAEAAITRFSGFLSSGGLILVSLKDDELSRLVQNLLLRELRFEHGVLYQQKTESPGWKTRRNRETPAFLVQAFRAKK